MKTLPLKNLTHNYEPSFCLLKYRKRHLRIYLFREMRIIKIKCWLYHKKRPTKKNENMKFQTSSIMVSAAAFRPCKESLYTRTSSYSITVMKSYFKLGMEFSQGYGNIRGIVAKQCCQSLGIYPKREV